VIFVAVFGVILIIQFIAMLFHRFATLEHMLVITQINWFKGDAQVGTVNSSPQYHCVSEVKFSDVTLNVAVGNLNWVKPSGRVVKCSEV